MVGHIPFGPDHTPALPMAEEQWQNGKSMEIAPLNRATAKVIFPLPQAVSPGWIVRLPRIAAAG